MQTYVILRHGGWATAQDLKETDGTVGTVCISQASSPEAIREHARRVDMPADQIINLADTVVVRPEPESVLT
jgi:sporulation protein YlmC with PRC-barrel domain